MSLRAVAVFLCLLSGFACACLFAGTTEPAEPTSRPSATEIKAWFADLANRDGTVRDAARQRLMGLDRASLPALRSAVQEARPIAPSQAMALPDIVTQVYLAGEPYDPDEAGNGFLGVKYSRASLSDDDSPVEVVERIPGFCAYRSLEDGDVILSLVGPPRVRFRNLDEFKNTIAKIPPGEAIEFELLRQGQVIRVPLKLDARPKATNDEPLLMQFRHEREDRASQYWQKNFAPLVGDGVS